MSTPCDHNVLAKEFDKLIKYSVLSMEMDKTWHPKTVIILMIVRGLGMIQKGAESYSRISIPGQLHPCRHGSSLIVRRALALFLFF